MSIDDDHSVPRGAAYAFVLIAVPLHRHEIASSTRILTKSSLGDTTLSRGPPWTARMPMTRCAGCPRLESELKAGVRERRTYLPSKHATKKTTARLKRRAAGI